MRMRLQRTGTTLVEEQSANKPLSACMDELGITSVKDLQAFETEEDDLRRLAACMKKGKQLRFLKDLGINAR
jgi:hypothetical protein